MQMVFPVYSTVRVEWSSCAVHAGPILQHCEFVNLPWFTAAQTWNNHIHDEPVHYSKAASLQHIQHMQNLRCRNNVSTITTSIVFGVQPHEWKSHFERAKYCVISSFCSCNTPISKDQTGMDPRDSRNPFETHPHLIDRPVAGKKKQNFNIEPI